jgi:GNAT superfamily N-acetyltransferase
MSDHTARSLHVHRLTAERVGDFRSLHRLGPDGGWCQCVAWWVPTWDGWGDRTREENAALRDSLFARGEYDGYLLYDGDRPVGWCQVGPAGRLEKLGRTFDLDPTDPAWAVTCFFVDPSERRHGFARALLEGMLADLRSRGISRVLAFPRHERDLPDGDVWTGPASLFAAAGFRPKEEKPRRTVWEWTAAR